MRSASQRHHKYHVTITTKTQDGRIQQRFYNVIASSGNVAKALASKQDRPILKVRKLEWVTSVKAEDKGATEEAESSRYVGESYHG